MSERLTLEVKPKDTETNSESLILIDNKGQERARTDVYVDTGFYSVYWHTDVHPRDLVEAANRCLEYYKDNYSDEMVTNIVLKTEVDPEDLYYEGTILYTKDKNNKGKREIEVHNKYPLSWTHLQDIAGDSEITYVRINTPYCDFHIDPKSVRYTFGVMGHELNTQGFEKLLQESTSGEIGSGDAKELFDAITSKFQKQTS